MKFDIDECLRGVGLIAQIEYFLMTAIKDHEDNAAVFAVCVPTIMLILKSTHINLKAFRAYPALTQSQKEYIDASLKEVKKRVVLIKEVTNQVAATIPEGKRLMEAFETVMSELDDLMESEEAHG